MRHLSIYFVGLLQMRHEQFKKKTQCVFNGDIKLCVSLKYCRVQKAWNPSLDSSVESHSSNRCFDAVKPNKFVGYPLGEAEDERKKGRERSWINKLSVFSGSTLKYLCGQNTLNHSDPDAEPVQW